MCGIFGTIRPHRYALRHAAADALLDLGYYAEERGRDSSGLAIFDGHGHTAAVRRAVSEPLIDLIDGRWRQVLSMAEFHQDLPRWPRLRTDLQKATIVLGHTRWATRGPLTLKNASPIRIGPIIGTHNGDVTVPADWPVDNTDTAYLYRNLAKTDRRRDVLAVLQGLRGRAALTWARIDQPGYLHLARTALSPLWIADDAAQGIWWASNPEWLRLIDADHDLGLHRIRPLREGTYRQLSTGPTTVRTVDHAKFTATSRARDERLAYTALRGFDPDDVETELAFADHDTQPAYSPWELVR